MKAVRPVDAAVRSVLLTGYFGRGNFGDDILTLVAFGLIRERWPDARISVLSDADDPCYLRRLLGDPNLEIIASGSRRRFDVIVHGGGGVFFDYEQGGLLDYCLNRLIRLRSGRPYVAFDAWLRRLLRREREQAAIRIGIGIGVGTYTSSSRKLRHHLPALCTFTELMVRDGSSLDNLTALRLPISARLGSDLAFIDRYWNQSKRIAKRGNRRPRLGMILRAWPLVAPWDHAEQILRVLPQLESRFDIRFYLFDAHSDRSLSSRLNGFEIEIWKPAQSTLDEYVAKLSTVDVLITSRAHGAICGAVLGIPSLLVDIEPKLRAVHTMLPSSTRILTLPTDIEPMLDALGELMRIPRHVIDAEVQHNRNLAMDGVARALGWSDD